MHTRTLGRQGLRTSAIGLGMGSTTTSFGERDAEVQVATMRRALDLEVNFLDSSDAYQQGRHERLIGEAIRGRRDDAIVASKFGNLDLPGGKKGYNARPDYVPGGPLSGAFRPGVGAGERYPVGYFKTLDG